MAFAAGAALAEEKKSAFVHFVVVPKALPGGGTYESVCEAFQAEMMQLAGGYTELGDVRGGSTKYERVVPKDNVAYIISSDQDISLQIKEAVVRTFGLKKVFILVWPGSLVR